MSPFEIAGLSVAAGEVVRGELGHVTLGDGTIVSVPVVIVNGAEDGAVLTVTTSVHGTEVVGVGAMVSILNDLDPVELRGTLVAVTAANPFAFQEGTYDTPYDHINLSGLAFREAGPGAGLTARLGGMIAPVVERSACVIDLHANPDPSIVFSLINPHLCPDDACWEETKRLADAFGGTVIESGGSAEGARGDLRHTHGVPTFTAELSGNMFLREDNVREGVIGVSNVMKALGMIDGEIEAQPRGQLQGDFVAHGRLVSNTGGMLWPRATPGVLLSEGDLVAEIVDVWGRVAEEIRMPVDGYCWAIGGRPGTTHVVAEGTSVNYIFRER